MPCLSTQKPASGILAVVLTLVALLLGPAPTYGDTPQDLPLFHISGLDYVGAARLPANQFGASELNFSEGPLAYNPANNSIFIVGHTYQQAIAEFVLPPLVKSSKLEDLQIAAAPRQVFSEFLGRLSGGNPQELNRIGGMCLVTGLAGPELLVNAYEYYDAPGDNSDTTFVVRAPSNLAGSAVDGLFAFAGGAGHTSGWISPIPAEWQSSLGGTYITGQSSGIPIISRTSVGPSAFVFDPLAIVGNAVAQKSVPTVPLLDFDLLHPLASDLSNDGGANDLWTHLSRAIYGFIPPGTRSYVTIGYSGGHQSGVCYKCTQNNGNTCGGYCAHDASDYYHYYWLWDMNDLLAVKAGTKNSFDVRPYEYGVFPSVFGSSELGGGSFDSASGILYLTVQRADNRQGEYANPPVIIGYRFKADATSGGPGGGGDSGGGANPGDEASPSSATIGKAGSRTIFCVKSDPQNMARTDRRGIEGKTVPVDKAITLIRRTLKLCVKKITARSTASLRRNHKNLRLALRRARSCKSGGLVFD